MMTDNERIALANELIEAYSFRLSDIANHIGVRDVKRTQKNLAYILKDAFADEIGEALRKKEAEKEFIDSGEAAIENKADEARQWYRDLMMTEG